MDPSYRISTLKLNYCEQCHLQKGMYVNVNFYNMKMYIFLT